MTDIDRLTKQLDDLVQRIDHALDADDLSKRVQRFHLEHDDGVDDGNGNGNGANGGDGGDGGSYPDTWSEHADASADGNNVDLADGEDDGDDGDVEDDFDKRSINEYLRENNEQNRPGSLDHSSHVSSSNSRHKFEALALKVKNDNGIPMSAALAQARMQFPEVFADFQRWRGVNGIGKRAPATYEDLLNAEMAKGLNAECAAQRVAQMYGFRALDFRSLSKRQQASVVAEDELMKRAQAHWEADPTASRTDALRAARQSSPRLYRALQR
jgi:hypothetical protein